MSDSYYECEYSKYEVTRKGGACKYKSLRVFAADDGFSKGEETDAPPERPDSPLRQQTFVYRQLEDDLVTRLKGMNLFTHIVEALGDFVEAIDGLYVRWSCGVLGVSVMLKDDFMEDNVEGIIREGVREMLDEIIYNA